MLMLTADGNGLYLRISEGGGRAWLLFVHVQGKRREMGLGSVKLYNLAEARERARKYRQIADAGKDPIAERDKQEAANKAELASRRTFKECAVEYIKLHEAQWRNAKFKKDWPASLESYGCIRIPASLNEFIDRYGILDADYEQAMAAGKRFWVLHPNRAPTPSILDPL